MIKMIVVLSFTLAAFTVAIRSLKIVTVLINELFDNVEDGIKERKRHRS